MGIPIGPSFSRRSVCVLSRPIALMRGIVLLVDDSLIFFPDVFDFDQKKRLRRILVGMGVVVFQKGKKTNSPFSAGNRSLSD